jgi:uncharacterized protein YkwD
MLTLPRRLAPFALAGVLLVPQAAPAAASATAALSDADLTKAGADLVTLTNQKRTARGLIALRLDPDLMQIARDRAQVMAGNDVLSHTEPNGTKVYDRLSADAIHWYAAGEIIAWNLNSTIYDSVRGALAQWMASSPHRAIMLSTDFNYVGFGVAVSASGKRYYAGVYVKQRDETPPWVKLGSVTKSSVDAGRVRVTVRWSGGDPRLQVLTAGFRYFQVQARRSTGDWEAWGFTTATSHSVTWMRGNSYYVRVRSRDKAGNLSAWTTIHIVP